jgi:hypothetical protein
MLERDIGEYLERLVAAPERIARATEGADVELLHRRSSTEPWSVNDILAHLRAAADNRTRFMRRMASGEHARLAYVSPRSELSRTDYVDRSFAENLVAFSSDRAQLVEWLRALPIDAWRREVSIRGRPETVATYARYLTEHELAHCKQIEALVGCAWRG